MSPGGPHRSEPGQAPNGAAGPKARSNPSLHIESINLQHSLIPQGLRGGEINPDPGQVVWFTGNGRVAPGEEGVSVVAGHVARGDGRDVFADLHKIRIGDLITTTDRNGNSTVYTTSRVYTTAKNELRSDPAVWGTTTRGKRLALVTCDDALGRQRDGHRVANFVVVATAL
ncbi:hypothetical protein GCM10023170_096300 [Phytohabitans houttuyneae]|uniref:Class F sortase n=2 Tax=Phytohabitans houttuyneae TaxID=1076126 RepID=A0A6V8KA44_9ACTN|nr:hypothetical protein Phou_062720 [Phytohabitans houttuyneae]